jgi:hypothetical protein
MGSSTASFWREALPKNAATMVRVSSRVIVDLWETRSRSTRMQITTCVDELGA